MPTNIETLKKIEYTSMAQLLEDLNRNFAVVQNSPLYKGIPGKIGGGGNPGLRGARGSSFLFVDLKAFQAQFPGELQTAAGINLTYLNSKLSVFETKNKLLTALTATELVDKDIIVLTNSAMLSYDFVNDKFVDTGQAFNEQTNLANSIEQQIETYVAYYIANSTSINTLKNIFLDYATYGKNYADTNNTFVTSSLTGSSVYSPYIPGYNSQIGIPVNDHKYFGFTDSLFPKLNKGSMVFGSMKRYYDMLMATISTDGSETLTSDYAPGANNIPAAIFLQDTYNNGLLFGYKDKANLKKFGSVYKNEIDELVLKSDSGKLASEYSSLLLHKDYLRYSKLVQFGNDLEVSRDFTVFGDTNSKGVRTGKFTYGANSGNSYNSKTTEIGVETAGSVTIDVAETVLYKQYLENVLVTDGTGKVLKSYKLETLAMDEGDIAGLNQISPIPNSPTSIPTSDYFSFLARKINSFSQFAFDNYWRKNQFNTGEIPDLKLSNTLTVVGDSAISGILSLSKNTKTATITADQINDNSVNRTFGFFKGNVLVTDVDGKLLKTYGIDNQILSDAELISGDLAIYSESKNTLATTYHYAHLAKKLNAVATALTARSWSKAQFETFDIPSLYLSADLKVRGNVMFNPGNGANVFEINAATKEMFLGASNTKVTFKANAIQLNNFPSNVLVTDSQGNLMNTYGVDGTAFNNAQQTDDNIVTGAPSAANSLTTGSQLGWVVTKLNNFITWLKANYWSRTQMADGSVANIRATTSIKSDNQIIAGDAADPTLNISGATASIGKSTGNTTLRGNVLKLENRPNIVVTTNANGEIQNSYSPETDPGAYSQAGITASFWANKTQSSSGNGPSSSGKFLTSIWFQYINANFNSIRALLFDRPTYAEINVVTPPGLIAMWDNVLGPVPAGWTICDGRVIPNSGGIATRNYVDKFLKGSTTPGTAGGNASSLLTLSVANMPSHDHPITIDSGGSHTHTMDYSGNHTHTYNPDDRAWRSDNANDRDVMVPGGNGRQLSTNAAGNHAHNIYYAGGHIHTGTADFNGSGTAFSIEPDSFTVIYIVKNP